MKITEIEYAQSLREGSGSEEFIKYSMDTSKNLARL